MKEELARLDKKETELFDEQVEIQFSVFEQIENLVQANFDSDTLKTKLISSMKSLSHIQGEVGKIRDQIDFIKKREKEGRQEIDRRWGRKHNESI